MATTRVLFFITSLLVLVHSQNICSPDLSPDSQLCSTVSDVCGNPLLRSRCMRYCNVCVDRDVSETVTRIVFTDSGIDPNCKDTSQFCSKYLDRCSFEVIQRDCRKTCGLCADVLQTTTTATAQSTSHSTQKSSKPESSTSTTTRSTATSNKVTAPTSPNPSQDSSSPTVPSASSTSKATSGSTSTEKTTVQLTTIDKQTNNLLRSAILLDFVHDKKMTAEIRLSGRIDRAVLDKISSELLEMLRRFSKPVERVIMTDVEDYRTSSGADITVLKLDIFLKSDGKKVADDLNSDLSAFRLQLHERFDDIFSGEEYQGLYGGSLPGPQTVPYIDETTTRSSDWWVHEYWYVILIVVLAFVILLVGAIIVPICLDRRRHRGIKIIDNGLAHTRV